MERITLFDLAKLNKGGLDIDIADNTIDMLVCFSYEVEDENEMDNLDKTLRTIAQKTNVICIDNGLIVVDMYKFCEKHYTKLLKLFNEYFYNFDNATVKKYGKEEIVANMVQTFPDIISGNVAISFYDLFANSFESNNNK